MAKNTSYGGYLTIPGSASDKISDGSTVGGDIVKNFKAIGDILQKQYSTVSVVGSRFTAACTSSYCSGTGTTMLGSSGASSNVPYSINTLDNKSGGGVDGITGMKGVCQSGDSPYDGYPTTSLGIPLTSTSYAVLDIEAIFEDFSGHRTYATYIVIVDPKKYNADPYMDKSVEVNVTYGTDINKDSRFVYSNNEISIQNPQSTYNSFILNIRYTLLTYARASYYVTTGSML